MGVGGLAVRVIVEVYSIDESLHEIGAGTGWQPSGAVARLGS